MNMAINTIPDIPEDTDVAAWLADSNNGFINTTTHTVTQSADGQKSIVT